MGTCGKPASRGSQNNDWCRNRRCGRQQDTHGQLYCQPEEEISSAEEQSFYARLQALQPVEVLHWCCSCLWTDEHCFGYPDFASEASGNRLLGMREGQAMCEEPWYG